MKRYISRSYPVKNTKRTNTSYFKLHKFHRGSTVERIKNIVSEDDREKQKDKIIVFLRNCTAKAI